MNLSASPQALPSIGADLAPESNCLLCGSPNCVSERSLTWGQLRKAWAVLGMQLSDEAWPGDDANAAVRVWRCKDCGFEFSNPEFAGNGQFYKELQAQNDCYYPTASPEFLRAVEFARQHDVRTVLDVGCGAGAFLNLMKKEGIQTHGVELNPEGARVARAAGHDVAQCLLEDLPTDKKFDMVTAWQVLEHVSHPVEVVRQAVRVMAPKGFFGMAVPYEKTMRWICPHDPHGWPPHHITRWQLRDLERLGQETGLRFISSGVEPMPGQLGKHFWLIHNQIAAALGFKQHAGGTFLPKLFWYLYRVSRAEKYLPLPGSSIYAFYARE